LADRTVVLVTHQPPRASQGWRILTLEHGRLTSSADPGEAGEAPVRRDRLAVAP
jgi:ABC-type transport system involved in cytochrome bd biosynthesis fused ATPase/permease subunit